MKYSRARFAPVPEPDLPHAGLPHADRSPADAGVNGRARKPFADTFTGLRPGERVGVRGVLADSKHRAAPRPLFSRSLPITRIEQQQGLVD